MYVTHACQSAHTRDNPTSRSKIIDLELRIVAMYLMTTERTILSGLPFAGNPSLMSYGRTLHPQVWIDLLNLGDEMFGARQPIETSLITTTFRDQGLLPDDPNNPGQKVPYNGRYRGEWFQFNDFFMRDAPQGHDGKNCENEVSHAQC